MLINTRADLDSLKGSPAYTEALRALKGSMTVTVDTAVYPQGYGQPGYSGAVVDPVWQPVEDLTSITRLGFGKDEFLAECAAEGV